MCLHLSSRTDRVMQELEESLGQIESVSAIKIIRSVAIDSLRFLAKLKLITGSAQHNGRWATSCFYNF